MEEVPFDEAMKAIGIEPIYFGFEPVEESEPKPVLGWMACKASFLLDGEPVTVSEAAKHWREGTAKVMPFADERLQALAALGQLPAE